MANANLTKARFQKDGPPILASKQSVPDDVLSLMGNSREKNETPFPTLAGVLKGSHRILVPGGPSEAPT
jgi:hypothetical protein